MNVKITLPELSAMMAQTTGFDAKACELFLRELFATIAETIVAGENVKVKGLGSFKSIEVEQRKSVNVNTGEQMIIPTHRKVTFTPDKTLAEAVNAPFAMFEPVEINDAVTDEMLEQAAADNSEYSETSEYPESSEIEKEREIIAEIQDSDQVQEDDLVPEHEKSESSQPIQEPEAEASQASEQLQEPEPEHLSEPNPSLTYSNTDPEPEQDTAPPYLYNERDEEPTEQKVTVETVPAEESAEPEKTETEFEETLPAIRRSSRFGHGFLMGAASAIVLVAVIVLCWYLISPTSLSSVFTGSPHPSVPEAATTKVAKAKTKPAAVTVDTAEAKHIQPVQKPEQLNVPTEPSDLDKADKTKADKADQPRYVIDKITKKRYLTTMARQYYGNYNLWPLIYDYNKGLGHPDRIRPGTKIKVPSAEELGIDPSDPAVLKRAKNRGRDIYAKYR